MEEIIDSLLNSIVKDINEAKIKHNNEFYLKKACPFLKLIINANPDEIHDIILSQSSNIEDLCKNRDKILNFFQNKGNH